MKKLLFILLLWPSLAIAGGPKYTYPSPPSPQGLDDEMNNIYHNISYPAINQGTASTMTITSLAVSTLTVNGSVFSQFQFQALSQATSSTPASTGSGSKQDCGLSVQVTPTSTTQRVEVKMTVPWQCNANSGNGDTDNQMYIDLIRGASTVVHEGRMGMAFAVATTQNALGTYTIDIIDSPATTSTVTYKCQYYRVTASATNATVQANSEKSVIIATVIQ